MPLLRHINHSTHTLTQVIATCVSVCVEWLMCKGAVCFGGDSVFIQEEGRLLFALLQHPENQWFPGYYSCAKSRRLSRFQRTASMHFKTCGASR